MIGEEVAELDEPLGDPRALVEQFAGGEERLRARPRRRWRAARAGRGRRGARVRIASSPKNSSSPTGGSPTRIDRRPRSAAPRSRRHGSSSSRPTITSKTRSTSSTEPAIRLMQSSDRQAGTSPTVLISPRDGLKPTTPLSAGGHPARAGRVGGDRERHLAERHRQRRPGARAAGDQLAAVHAARDRVRRPGAVQPGGELVEVGLADVDRAGVEQLAARRARWPSRRRRSPGRPAWSARPRRRCCP